jgi:hypothetical protein
MDRQAFYAYQAQCLHDLFTEPGHTAMSYSQSLTIENMWQTIFFCRNVSKGAGPVHEHYIIRVDCDLFSHARDLFWSRRKLSALVGQNASPDL